MTLSDRFHEILGGREDNPEVQSEVAEIVLNAPESPERCGLLSLIYHEGIGIPANLGLSFEYAEKGAEGGDGLAYFMLGYMCDNAETPDQAEGGPRQKYDHYDAERFYEKSAAIESRWQTNAHLWLGDYFMDSARGGDSDEAIEHYEAIAKENAEAAGKLSDYYWNLIMPEYLEDEEWRSQLFRWTKVASDLNPEEYSYRMGWLYADAIGCDEDIEKAFEHFHIAVDYGDWRGARFIADILKENIEDNKSLTSEEKQALQEDFNRWSSIADQMYEEYLLTAHSESDPSEEED